MQSVSSRIWTRVAVSISYDDKHYTTGTSSKETIRKALPELQVRSEESKESKVTIYIQVNKLQNLWEKLGSLKNAVYKALQKLQTHSKCYNQRKIPHVENFLGFKTFRKTWII